MCAKAVGQICSTASMAHNLEQCRKLMEEAAGKGAKVWLRFSLSLFVELYMTPYEP